MPMTMVGRHLGGPSMVIIVAMIGGIGAISATMNAFLVFPARVTGGDVVVAGASEPSRPVTNLKESGPLYVNGGRGCPPPNPEIRSEGFMTAFFPRHAFNKFVGCVVGFIRNDHTAAAKFIDTMTDPWGRAVAMLTFEAVWNANPDQREIWEPFLRSANDEIQRVRDVRARSQAYMLLAAGYIRVEAAAEAHKALKQAYKAAISIDRGANHDEILQKLVLLMVAPEEMREAPRFFGDSRIGLRLLVSTKTLDLSGQAGRLALEAAEAIDDKYDRVNTLVAIARAIAVHGDTGGAEEIFVLAEQAAQTGNWYFAGDKMREIARVRLAILGLSPLRRKSRELSKNLLDTRECEGCDLSKRNFNGANLAGAELSGANLDWASLRGASLAHANLANTRLWGADLREVAMQKAVLRQAYLSEAGLGRANLSGANLFGADLSGSRPSVADLSNAILRSANLRGVYASNTNFDQSDMRSANLSIGTFWAARFVNANLQDANLSHGKFYKADFTGADLRRANLHGALLLRANLTGANLREANLGGPNLVDHLGRAIPRSSNLHGLNADYAEFRNADLRNANLTNCMFFKADLSGADLRNADLSNAKFGEANFIGADLRGADLRDAYLKGANPTGAKLKGANLDGANMEGVFRVY